MNTWRLAYPNTDFPMTLSSERLYVGSADLQTGTETLLDGVETDRESRVALMAMGGMGFSMFFKL